MTKPRTQPVDHGVLVPHGTPLPPPPPGVRHVPIMMVGVIIATDDLRRRVDRFFHWPMIVLALAMLPLLALEFLPRTSEGLRSVLKIGFAIIWAAFLIEFVAKITIAECRIEYVRRHWLDLIIILVPVLRPLRAAFVVKTARVFKVRGVAMKLVTILIGMEATDRLLQRLGLKQRPEAKDPRDMTRYEMTREIRRLRDLTDRWERWYDAHEEYVARHGGPCHAEPRPRVEEDGAEACPDAS